MRCSCVLHVKIQHNEPGAHIWPSEKKFGQNFRLSIGQFGGEGENMADANDHLASFWLVRGQKGGGEQQLIFFPPLQTFTGGVDSSLDFIRHIIHPLNSLQVWKILQTEPDDTSCLPDQIPPAGWTRPCWRHDPTSGRWTDRLPYDQTKAEKQLFFFFVGQMTDRVSEKICRKVVFTHPALVAFYFDLYGLWDPVFSPAKAFTCLHNK